MIRKIFLFRLFLRIQFSTFLSQSELRILLQNAESYQHFPNLNWNFPDLNWNFFFWINTDFLNDLLFFTDSLHYSMGWLASNLIRRDTFSTSPISVIRIRIDVPPYQKNGRIIPVFGIQFVTTMIFNTTCYAICDITPTTSREENKSGALFAITIQRQSSKTNNRMTQIAPNNPSSSQIMVKIKSFCASGT